MVVLSFLKGLLGPHNRLLWERLQQKQTLSAGIQPLSEPAEFLLVLRAHPELAIAGEGLRWGGHRHEVVAREGHAVTLRRTPGSRPT